LSRERQHNGGLLPPPILCLLLNILVERSAFVALDGLGEEHHYDKMSHVDPSDVEGSSGA
jgi:hypothetical protein